MPDITALGELLIDYTPAGTSSRGMPLYEQNPGGAPANVLVTAARLGLSAALIARVGRDGQGAFLRRTLMREGVDLLALSEDPAAPTTLAFVTLSETGERSFSFVRGADAALAPEHVPAGLIEGSRVLHLGTLSMTGEPVRSATREAVKRAKAAGVPLSLDPNWRPLLWPDEAAALPLMRELLSAADFVKLSEEEAPLLTGEREPARAAAAVLGLGASLVAVTLGDRGAYLASRTASASIPAEPVTAVDSTGAGDAFWGAALVWLLRRFPAEAPLSPAAVAALDAAELSALGRFACGEAARCVSHRGAW